MSPVGLAQPHQKQTEAEPLFPDAEPKVSQEAGSASSGPPGARACRRQGGGGRREAVLFWKLMVQSEGRLS